MHMLQYVAQLKIGIEKSKAVLGMSKFQYSIHYTPELPP